jgi:hypothetical protein
MIKAQKAYFALISKVNPNNGANPRTLLKLFDALILPILLYASEIWGLSSIRLDYNNDLLEQLFSKEYLCEKLHIKFCKRVLMIGKCSSNIGVLAELGRFPLVINLISKNVQYFLKLQSIKNNSILSEAYKVSGWLNSTWFSTCSKLVQAFNLEISNKSSNSTPYKGAIKSLKKEICAKYMEKFFIDIQKSNKLDIYKQVKKCYKMESYLCSIKNISNRAALSKLRLSAHTLPIEKLRGKEPRENRYCIACGNTTLGDEKHVLLECPHPSLVKHRFKFYCKLNQLYPGFSQFSNESKLILILMGHDNSMFNICAEFIEAILASYPK